MMLLGELVVGAFQAQQQTEQVIRQDCGLPYHLRDIYDCGI